MRDFYIVSDNFRKHPHEEIKLPTRGSKFSAGYDMYLPIDITIKKGETSPIIPLDIKANMKDDEVLFLMIRSSMGIKKGLSLANTTGVIDKDYFENPDNDGNIGIALCNNSSTDIHLEKGERIVQGIFMEYKITDSDETKQERMGGFGSTGAK